MHSQTNRAYHRQGRQRGRGWVWLACMLLLSITPAHVQAQAPRPSAPFAPIVNDEGGPVRLSGEVDYTNPYFTIGVAQPLILLEDQAGFIDRDPNFILPLASQTVGQITSDFRTSPFGYTLALPAEPLGSLRDVDQDDTPDPGVMVFAVAYWTNKFGDPLLEERDLYGGGWSTAYASTRVADEVSRRREVIGGQLIVYAPDNAQEFPTDFGPDARLFTADDPLVTLPAGYTLVDLDADPFVFDRSRYPTVDLIEPPAAAPDDFAELDFAAAFDGLVATLKHKYAFTAHKAIDWDALAAAYRPRMAEAALMSNRQGYLTALHEFSLQIPDGHVQGGALSSEQRRLSDAGIGLALAELDDGSVIADYLMLDGPAADASIAGGDEILAINDQPISDWIDATVAWSGPHSTDHARRLQQVRYATRFAMDAQVSVTYQPYAPGTQETPPITVNLTAIEERAGFTAAIAGPTGYELPLTYHLLPSGYVYVQINSFYDNELLTIQLWERLMRTLNSRAAPGLIIDLRRNGGGSGFLADQLAAYFFEEELELGQTAYYNAEIDGFYADPHSTESFILPAEDLRYRGPIAVLVGPSCASACEFFAYALTLQDRAAFVGYFPTAGMGGSIAQVRMPAGQNFQYTAGRAIDMTGTIHIEGQGVEPTLRVPRTRAQRCWPKMPNSTLRCATWTT